MPLYRQIYNKKWCNKFIWIFLYNLYVSKLQNFIPHRIIQYADGTTILVNYRELSELNILLKELSHKINVYFNGLGLLLNIGKTQIMLIGEKKVQDLCFNGVSISSSTSVKFLGIMIDSSIYFNSHAHFITLKLRKMFYTLYNIQHHHFSSHHLCISFSTSPN